MLFGNGIYTQLNIFLLLTNLIVQRNWWKVLSMWLCFIYTRTYASCSRVSTHFNYALKFSRTISFYYSEGVDHGTLKTAAVYRLRYILYANGDNKLIFIQSIH